VRDVRGVVAVGEQDECVIDAQLGAPFIEGHAEFVVEQSAECAGAGSDGLPESGQCGVVIGSFVQNSRNSPQPVVVWFRQM